MDHRLEVPPVDTARVPLWTSLGIQHSLRGDSRESPYTAHPRTLYFFLRAAKRSASRNHSPNKALSVYRMRNRREHGDDNRRRLTMRTMTMIIEIDQRENIAVPVRNSRPCRFPARNGGGLWAPAFLDDHARQPREYDLVLVVKVQHCDFGQLPRCAAWPGVVRWFRQADDMRIRIGWKESHRTVARTVIGIVSATKIQGTDR